MHSMSSPSSSFSSYSQHLRERNLPPTPPKSMEKSTEAFLESNFTKKFSRHMDSGVSDLIRAKFRGGSLPLKKRRVVLFHEQSPHPMEIHDNSNIALRNIHYLLSNVTDQSDPRTGDSMLKRPSYFNDQESPDASAMYNMNPLTLIAVAASYNEMGTSKVSDMKQSSSSLDKSAASSIQTNPPLKPCVSFNSQSVKSDISINDYLHESNTSSCYYPKNIATLKTAKSEADELSELDVIGLSQDKKKSVTTPGRPCSYSEQLVDSSISDSGSVNFSTAEEGTHEVEDDDFGSPSTLIVPDANKKSTLNVGKFKMRRTNAKIAGKHAESPYPLLSMIATEQWYNQQVRIAVGPFKGKSGSVQKWGNGWITVLIDGVGCHNRRSFELYLDTSEGNLAKSLIGEKVAMESNGKVSKLKQGDAGSFHSNNQQLFRCVSIDLVSPSPPSSASENCKSNKSWPITENVAGVVTPKALVLSPHSSIHSNNEPNKTVDSGKASEVLSISQKYETPNTMKRHVKPTSLPNIPPPKVTPYLEKSSLTTRSRCVKIGSSFDMQFPIHDEVGLERNYCESSLIFRPSMGERTRGRTSSLGNTHTISSSSIAATPDTKTKALSTRKTSRLPKKRSRLYMEL